MARVVVASFNVENLFARPKAFDTSDRSAGEPILAAYHEFNALAAAEVYTPAIRARMRALLVALEVYTEKDGVVRRNQARDPRWAWLRKNRGTFDREPKDTGKSVEIIAGGRGDWIGWVELAKESVDEVGTRTTARVITEVDADVLALVEVEDRPSLVRLNKELLGGRYEHVMLVDGNDDRGIDVGIMTKKGFSIESIRSNVDIKDGDDPVFSRDCAQYEIRTPTGKVLHVLVNHFKSQSGGGGKKRLRQAREVRRIAGELVAARKNVIVLGDLNEGQPSLTTPARNLKDLFDGPLRSCYDLKGFDTGKRPGTFDSCGIRNRLDYVLVSSSLQRRFTAGHVFRKGLWGTRTTRPTDWETYPEMTNRNQQASDHAAVVVELDL
ncbi:endonuclease/exonuclease/phosphatase family protein [Actinophytocola algeriensis]|uniref:Endonuclease/exonuclease/phosphatase family metal-dependent hydrolase n=1 Tax=Actinophytocola algeriensis TaxID=1768010 RepID=A0A7W7PZZ7_9PSEU|nr:endonuclease/exonuclease/phosphatase family protein [Actinophytocola algeriensis]MBB4904328.1 endonuclease/exonuclease/phosphatase family metal-dependent hydrolase [Actinophytocola algeriensis]MBE1476814.1 endonuclease/exonuclease/phosphatase family metal-dependent hydrolase [Actinophytocola algeriensis]